MSVSSYMDDEERESKVLRASVVDAAMKLGPKVTGWMFDNALAEEEEEDEMRMRTPDLMSSCSSEDSHSVTFSSQDGHTYMHRPNPLISLPAKLTNTLEQSYYLNSPFIVVDHGRFPQHPYISPINTRDIPRNPGLSTGSSTSASSTALSPRSNSPAPKKSSKFPFSPRKPAPSPQSSISVSVSQASLSSSTTSPKKLSLDDPVPRAVTPVAARAPTPTSARTKSPSAARPGTPTKLKKSRPAREPVEMLIPTPKPKAKERDAPSPRAQGWDFKDPDRPSFFAAQEQTVAVDVPPVPELPKGVGKEKGKGKVRKKDGEDGYVSEGGGKKAKEKEKEKRSADKDKDKRPGMKRSMTSRLMSKWSSPDLRASSPPPLGPPPPPPVPVPIHDRFAGKSVRTVVATREAKVPTQDEDDARPARLDVPSPSAPRARTPSPAPSTTSSFAFVPDLNISARQHWPPNPTLNANHPIGADNATKLAMLARLITEPVPPAPVPVPEITVHAPQDTGEVQFVVPDPVRPSSAVMRYYDVPVTRRPEPRAGSAPPTMLAHQDTAPVRGRQAPFPTRPVLPKPAATLTRQTSRARLAGNPWVGRALPKRYEGVGHGEGLDVPRSVRSSFTKEQEREEEWDGESVYSEGSRASFMDVGRSGQARDKFVQAVEGGKGEPGWL